MPLSQREQPVFVLCMARSGSTLLRYSLDTHPQICAPPEMHIAATMFYLQSTYQSTLRFPEHSDSQQQQHFLRQRTKQSIDQILDDVYALKGDAHATDTLWCEKSIHTVKYIDTVLAVYPAARFLILHRDCLDQVTSALDTLSIDPSGNAYDFASYLAATEHPMLGLVEHWIAKTDMLLRGEQFLGDRCLRLRYEDLINQPRAILERTFSFLGVAQDDSLVDRIFTTPHRDGAGDHKIRTARSISRDSITKAHSLDLSLLSTSQHERISSLQRELGYDPLC